MIENNKLIEELEFLINVRIEERLKVLASELNRVIEDALKDHKNTVENEDSSFITKEQLEDIEYELADYTDIANQVLEGLHIERLSDIPKSKFRTAINRIREIKNARNNPQNH